MASKIAEDPRIDPRIKALLGAWETLPAKDVASREELLAIEASDTANKRAAALEAMLAAWDTEAVAPSTGLTTRTERFVSAPDGNQINIQFIRPDGAADVP